MVPTHLRVNADKKRKQMISLEESMYTMKMSFNRRLIAMRDLKVKFKSFFFKLDTNISVMFPRNL